MKASLSHLFTISNLLLFVLLISSKLILARDQNDSLVQTALKMRDDDTNKVNLLNQISKTLGYNDLMNSEKYGKQALELAEHNNYQKGIAEGHNNLGNVYFNQNDYETALGEYNESLSTSKRINYRKGIANSYGNIAGVYNAKRSYDTALIYYLLALALRNELSDERGISLSHYNIGTIKQQRGQFEEALKHHLTSLKFATRLNDKYLMAIIHSAIATIYTSTGMSVEAIDHFLNAISIYKELGITSDLIYAYINMGSVHVNQKDFPRARINFNRALSLLQTQTPQDQKALAAANHNLGNSYLLAGESNTAVRYFLKALEINSQKIDSVNVVDKIGVARNHCVLGDAYVELGNIKVALTNYQLALEIQQSLNDSEGLAATYNGMGLLYEKMNNHVLAEKYALIGFRIAGEIKSVSWRESNSLLLSQIYEKQGHYNAALKFHKIYHSLFDSIYNTRIAVKINTMDIRHEQAMKEFAEKEEAAKRKQILLIKLQQKREETKRTLLFNYLLIMIGAFFIFIPFVRLFTNRISDTLDDKSKARRAQTIRVLGTALLLWIIEAIIYVYHQMLHAIHLDNYPFVMVILILPIVYLFDILKNWSEMKIHKHSHETLNIVETGFVKKLRNLGLLFLKFLNTLSSYGKKKK